MINVYFVNGNDEKTKKIYDEFSKKSTNINYIVLRGNGYSENEKLIESAVLEHWETDSCNILTNDEEFLDYGWNEDYTQLNLWFYYDELEDFVYKDYVYPALRLQNNLGRMFRCGLFDLSDEDIKRIKKKLGKK